MIWSCILVKISLDDLNYDGDNDDDDFSICSCSEDDVIKWENIKPETPSDILTCILKRISNNKCSYCSVERSL